MTPGFDRDHRLDARGGAGCRHELSWFGNGFEVHHDRPRGRISGKKVEPIASVHIGHVAERNDVGEADIVFAGPVYERGGDGAGLGQQRDVAGLSCHMGETRIQPQRRDHQADRIGADDPEEMRTRGIEHCLAKSVLNRQPCGDDDAGTTALFAEFIDNLRDDCRWRHDNGEVRRLGERSRVGVAWQTADLPVFGIDRPNSPLESAFDDIVDDDASNGAFTGGSADDRQRTRPHRKVEISAAHRVPLSSRCNAAVQGVTYARKPVSPPVNCPVGTWAQVSTLSSRSHRARRHTNRRGCMSDRNDRASDAGVDRVLLFGDARELTLAENLNEIGCPPRW